MSRTPPVYALMPAPTEPATLRSHAHFTMAPIRRAWPRVPTSFGPGATRLCSTQRTWTWRGPLIAASLIEQRNRERCATATQGEIPCLAAGSPLKGGTYVDTFNDGTVRVLRDLPLCR